ncbi:MAG TPA: hypothetical protein DD670_11590 [Planctomycetaceae bacterium]|nr:hypothetical protein [Planctomycetaceae bacterium]
MTDQNPYAAPAPTPEELPRPLKPMPQTLRAAVWQGLKVGFKWGTIVAIGLIALAFVIRLVISIMAIWQHARMPSVIWLDFVGGAVTIYGVCSVLGTIAGVIISSFAYLLRKGIAALHRWHGDTDG